MHERVPAARSLERDRRQVEAAILLVAGGRYPSVVVANLTHADPIAMGLCASATRHGVRITTARRETGPGSDLVLSRR